MVRSTRSYSILMICLITPSSGWRDTWLTSGEAPPTCPAGHPFKSTAPDFGGSQSIVTNGNTIPVVSSAATLSIDIGKFTLEEYGCYATSGLPLSYATSNAAVIAVDSATGKLDPKGAGTATITLSQGGDSHFSAASSVTLSIAISEDRSQTIDFPALPDMNASSSAQTVTLGATASSGLAVTYTSSDTSKATISGTTMAAANALGSVSITASQSGGTDPSNSNVTYIAAESITQTFSISKSDQFITFAALPIVTSPMAPPSHSQPPQVPDSPSPFDSNDTNLLTISVPPPPSRVQGRLQLLRLRLVMTVIILQVRAGPSIFSEEGSDHYFRGNRGHQYHYRYDYSRCDRIFRTGCSLRE